MGKWRLRYLPWFSRNPQLGNHKVIQLRRRKDWNLGPRPSHPLPRPGKLGLPSLKPIRPRALPFMVHALELALRKNQGHPLFPGSHGDFHCLKVLFGLYAPSPSSSNVGPQAWATLQLMAWLQNQFVQLDKPISRRMAGAIQKWLMRDQNSELALNKSSSPQSTSLFHLL